MTDHPLDPAAALPGGGKALAALCAVPWAILPEWLPLLAEIAARENPTPEAVAAQLGRPLDYTHTVTVRDGVAILPVEGPIFPKANLFTAISGATSIDVLAQDFYSALSDPAIHSILLAVDSPGGAVAGVSEFAQMVFDARGRKPITAYVSDLGASAAYWLASAADEIVLADTAQLGSIGVVAAMRDPRSQTSREIEFVSSQSPRKRPDPTTEAGRAQAQELVDSLAEVFVAAVGRYRSVNRDVVVQDFGRGGLLVGEAAVRAGMADRLGSFEQTVAALQQRTPATAQGGRMGFRERWAQFTASLSPGEMAEMAEETGATAETPPARVVHKQVGDVSITTAEGDATARDAAMAERITALGRELAEERAAKDAQAAIVAQATDRVAALEAAARAKRFTDEVLGHGTASGQRWYGDVAAHVGMLDHLATTAGEDSDLFRGYVERNRAHAAQLQQSGLLAEVGRPGAGMADDPTAALNGLITARIKDTGCTYGEAYTQIVAEYPDLAASHKRAIEVRV